jgi:hypothetical protein
VVSGLLSRMHPTCNHRPARRPRLVLVCVWVREAVREKRVVWCGQDGRTHLPVWGQSGGFLLPLVAVPLQHQQHTCVGVGAMEVGQQHQHHPCAVGGEAEAAGDHGKGALGAREMKTSSSSSCRAKAGCPKREPPFHRQLWSGTWTEGVVNRFGKAARASLEEWTLTV